MSVETADIYATQLGGGARHALALHCTLAHSGAWGRLAEHTEDALRFTAIDMPSHGRSADWDGRGDFQDVVVNAAEPFLQEPMDLIGHSFGATVALRLALKHPRKVRSLTLIEPVFFAVALADRPDTVRDHDALAGDFNAAIEAGDMELAARLFNRMWGDGPKWPDMPKALRAAMTRAIHVVPSCKPAIYDDVHGLLAPGILSRADMPVLLIRGSTSLPIMAAVNDGLAKRLPDARNEVIEGAGHMAPITHPAETARLLKAFLDG
ncbi:alpha/beta fold hydrolase [Thalassococcus sp. S3]|uniref:alpha/beta fold hydrolase n=1 Tax=Thalassococcus sp. S3 TaxID=2017482 RepID=UPI0010241C56|nr:alpha/beta hydrolase [Thalassococcus sp. S3]QBF30894.1 alpha/beta hydrolase [Thalassococcus sp. S3]